jgi:hypothetical protein
MGALKSAASYLRFFVDGEAPTGLGDIFEQAIESHRFVPLDPKGAEMESSGWVAIEDPFDDELPITRDRFHFGDLIALGYREDRVSLPRPLVISRLKKKLAELEARGEKITRSLRKSAEAAVLSELKRQTLPRPRVMDVVWDMSRNEARIFGRGPMATERAVACFERTFGTRVRMATWGGRAFNLDLSLRARGILENLTPETVFEDPVSRAHEAEPDA